MVSKTILGMSIDIGSRNLAFYIEEFNRVNILSLCPCRHMYEKEGTCTQVFSNILDKIERNGFCVFFDLFDSGSVVEKCFLNITEYLDNHRYIFDLLSFIIIEKQMKKNTNAQRIAQHIYSYFTFIYYDWKPIILFPSKLKTKILGCPKKDKGMSRPKRYKYIKEWAVKKAQKIFEKRNDINYLNLYSALKKNDDVADAICQMQAFKVKVFYMNEHVY